MPDEEQHPREPVVPPDPVSEEEPHDVLAAEEFAIPTEEPGIPHDRATEPHDVLAAEEFAMPAGGDVSHRAPARGPRIALIALAAGMALLCLRRLRRR